MSNFPPGYSSTGLALADLTQNPIKFGADPTGIGDSFPAFQAIAALVPVGQDIHIHVTLGTYNMSATFTGNNRNAIITVDAGVTFTGTYPALYCRTVQNVLNGVTQTNYQGGTSSVVAPIGRADYVASGADTMVITSPLGGNSGRMSIGYGGTAPAYTIDAGGFVAGYAPMSRGTKFTTTGCSVSATTGGAAAGTITSGITGACTVIITLNGATGLTAPTGWACFVNNQTTANLIRQTASTTTTATVSGTTVTGDVLSFGCTAY